MIPIKQKPNGCFAACIASITEIPLDEIPHPPEDCLFTREEWSVYNQALVKFLRDRGWFITTLWSNAPKGYAIASGPSPRIPDADHSCVAFDGVVVHDPHPDGTGLSEIREFEIIVPLVKTPA